MHEEFSLNPSSCHKQSVRIYNQIYRRISANQPRSDVHGLVRVPLAVRAWQHKDISPLYSYHFPAAVSMYRGHTESHCI